MANTVIAVRSSSATGNQPSLGVIANGELSLNFADGILYYKTSSNTLGQIRTTQVSGSNQQVQFNDSGSFGSSSQFTFDKNTGLLSAPTIKASQSSGDEGGQLDLATAATNSTLAGGSVSIDIYQNKLRFFETGGSNRGAYIDLTAAGTGVSTNLISGGGGAVTSVGGQTGAISNTQLVSFVTTPTLPTTGNIIVYNGTSFASLANTGTAGTYANAAYVPVITTDAYGRVSSVTNTAIAIAASQITSGTLGIARGGTNQTSFTNGIIAYNGTSLATLANTGTAGTYGNSAYVPVVTTDAYGRVSAVTNTAISIPTTAVTGTFGFSSGGTNATSYTTGTVLVSNGTAIVSLANTGTAGTYGNSAYVPVVTTDAYGRVSSVVNTAISIPTTAVTGVFGFGSGGTNATSYTTGTLLTSNGTAIISLANTGTAGTYGNSTYVPIITTDAYGRVTSITNTAITAGGSITSVGGQTGSISNTQLVSFVTTPTLPTTGNIIVYNGTSFASLANTGTAGTYGNAAYHPVITTDAYGRVSAVTNTAISISTTAVTGTFGFSSGGTNATSYTTGTLLTSNGTAIISLANTGTAGTYGNATYVPVITTDAYGRVTSVTNTAISGGGGSSTFNIYNVNSSIFQATANGAQTSFSLGFTPVTSNNLIVTTNGVVQYDYSIVGSTLTFNFTPANNTIVRVQSFGSNTAYTITSNSTPVFNNISVYNVNTQIFQATANGAQTSFSLGFTPSTSNNAVVTANGVVQYDYSITGSTLTLNFTPPNNTIIRVQAFGISSPNVMTPVFTTGNLIISDGNTLVSLANTGTAGTYANASYVPVITTDAYGRVSSVVNTAISIPASSVTTGTMTGNLTVSGNLTSNTVTINNGIIIHSSTIGANQTISTGYNGLSAGPITINSGIAITVSNSSVWKIV